MEIAEGGRNWVCDQNKFFQFASNIHPVWYGNHFTCGSGAGCIKNKGWAPIVFLRYLLEAGILECVTVEEAIIIFLTKQTKVWLPENRDISCAIIRKAEKMMKNVLLIGL